MKKQCSNPKCRKGKIGGSGGATISGLGNAFMNCIDCGAKFEDVDDFYPEPEENTGNEYSAGEA